MPDFTIRRKSKKKYFRAINELTYRKFTCRECGMGKNVPLGHFTGPWPAHLLRYSLEYLLYCCCVSDEGGRHGQAARGHRADGRLHVVGDPLDKVAGNERKNSISKL